ncbi:MAG: DUF996 domain-containing protein [Candidatus Bathyarchaeota archaeon]|nr:DUF996 domain-containing protein [Candidatus Bathyarchaeota archaeon]MDH5747356.1 DUF996 domain-containing protein [Candidatus Bathyarchaeota archaeon]
MNLETCKNLGGVGAILLVIGLVGIIGTGYSGVLSLIGLVLVLIAMKGLSDYYKDAGIFNNTLYGFVTSIIAVVAFVAVIVVALLETIANLGIADWTNSAEWVAAFQANLSDMSAFFTLIGGIILAFVVLFILLVIAAIFYRKSLNMLSSKSGVGMFSTAGLLLLIGAVLTIILIGVIVIWIAIILLAVAFFSIKPATTQETPSTSPPT